MSPEQVQCEELDERSDLYSLACVAWELIVGCRMVQGKQVGEMILNVLSEPAPPVSRFLSWVPPAVDQHFDSALAKAREDRPKDVESWAASLAALLEGLDAEAGTGWLAPGWADERPVSSAATGVPTDRKDLSAEKTT